MGVISAALYRIADKDNVATAIGDVEKGRTTVFGTGGSFIETIEPISFGFKAALCDIEEGELIIKYGIPIARATKSIRRGECVHSHNAKSLNDIRSSHFDIATAAPEDMRYDLYEEE